MKFERARTAEQINERKDEIINACAKLYDDYGYYGVNLKEIGDVTSFSRSTIYLYYKTKEEILLDLLLREARAWNEDIHIMMKQNDTLNIEQYCKKMTEVYVKNDRLIRLISMLYTSIENNCTVEKLAESKKELFRYSGALALSIDKYFPDLPQKKKMVFLSSSISLISGLYPNCNLTDKQKRAIELSGVEYEPSSFSEMCYEALLMLCTGFGA